MLSLSAFWDSLTQDLRYGWRMLIARPGFSAVAVLSIALGIGATTSIFSVIYAVLMDPYPYRAADRIGQLSMSTPYGNWQFDLTMPQYLELKSATRSFEDQVAVIRKRVVMTGKGLVPEVVVQEDCSSNMFDFYGVPPLFGRVFTPKDFPPGRVPGDVAVISYQFWQHAFQGSRDVIGRNLVLNGKTYTIIGVLPIRFTWHDVDAYTPMALRPDVQEYVQFFARIKPGVTQQQIAAEFNPLLEKFRKQVPSYNYPPGRLRIKWLGVNEGILGKFQNTLLALFGAVLLLLLIACGNVANLLLARAATREGEMAIRVSIGATRIRLMRQMLTESILLALTGGLLGVGLALAGVKAVIALMPDYSIPHEAIIAVNWPVLWFAAAISVLTGVLFGFAPALQISRKTQPQALKDTGRGGAMSAGRRRFHDALMVSELILSLVLLTGAGLAVKGLLALEQQRLGYDPSNVMSFNVPLGEGKYNTWATRRAFFDSTLDRLARIPGVQAAALTETGVPPWNGFTSKLTLDDRPAAQAPTGRINPVSGGFFQTIRVPLLRGRLLTPSDVERANPVTVIAENMAKRYFPNQNPIGRHVQVDVLNERLPKEILKAPRFNSSFEIVGVVGTARNKGLREEADPAMYIPFTIFCTPNETFLVRTSSDPMHFVNQVRHAVTSLDPNEPIAFVRSLEWWLNTATAYPRFATFLFGVFGGIGLLLAAAGIFSVVSYAVAHRTREFGIRMALGARPGDVLRLVLTAITRVLVIGLAIGSALSIFASHALADRMEGMGTADVSLFAVTPAVLIIATLAACLFPARAATLVEPVQALRHE